MFEVICQKCKKIYDYNFDLEIPDKPSHGICQRCKFIESNTWDIKNPFKKFIYIRQLNFVYWIFTSRKESKHLKNLKKTADFLESQNESDITGLTGILSF